MRDLEKKYIVVCFSRKQPRAGLLLGPPPPVEKEKGKGKKNLKRQRNDEPSPRGWFNEIENEPLYRSTFRQALLCPLGFLHRA